MAENLFLIYILTVGLGLLLEAGLRRTHFHFTKKHYMTHHFSVGKYLFFLLFPLIGIAALSFMGGVTIIQVFVVFALVGTFLEWLAGWTYDAIVGQRLWTYHRYALGKYTSFLSVPLWGVLGVGFYVLAIQF